jgi:HK97 family phage major capsid protein
VEKFIEELKEMNLEQVEQRLSDLEKEIRDAKAVSELEGMDEKITALKERHAELKELEKRKQNALGLQNGEIKGKVIEERGKEVMENAVEKRAKEFAENGKVEMRALLSTGRIAAPTKATGISDLAEVASDIVDDVHAVPLTGAGAWTVGYKKTNAVADDVTDGEAIGGTASTYDYVTINPSEWGVTDEVSNQVKKMTPVDYLSAVETSALIALRAKASDKIVAAVKASELTEKKTGVALDADYLKNLVLGFRAIKTKGAVVLYLAQADLLTLGKVRGTQEKKALFDITFDNGSTTAGVIKEGGMAVRFRVLDQLAAGEQLFGQPGAIDMPMWDNYEIKTDEGGEYFKNNQIGIRGIQTAGADLVAYHGMQHITQS